MVKSVQWTFEVATVHSAASYLVDLLRQLFDQWDL
jgi:hypothetical protein